jgi:hypothetical protein
MLQLLGSFLHRTKNLRHSISAAIGSHDLLKRPLGVIECGVTQALEASGNFICSRSTRLTFGSCVQRPSGSSQVRLESLEFPMENTLRDGVTYATILLQDRGKFAPCLIELLRRASLHGL